MPTSVHSLMHTYMICLPNFIFDAWSCSFMMFLYIEELIVLVLYVFVSQV